MDDMPICLCAEQWPGQGHHPECPVRQRIAELEQQVADVTKSRIWNVNRAEKAEARIKVLEQELRNIATADLSAWDGIEKDDQDRQFRLWAKNRARAAISKEWK